LTWGFSVQNIPLVVSDINHEYRVGFSYKISRWGPRLFTAYHVNQREDSFHFGFETAPSSKVRLYVGAQDFENKNLAFGGMFEWENLNIYLTYSLRSQRLLFSLSTRIGKAPRAIADERMQACKTAIKAGKYRNALKDVRIALAHDITHSEARTFYNWLAPKIKKENARIDSLLQVAKSHEEQQWYISAAVHYLKVLKIDPDNKMAVHSIKMIRPKVNIHTERWFQSAVKDFERGDYERAKDVFESILIVRSDHKGSKEYLQKIKQIEDEEVDRHFYTGLGFYSQKNFARAKQEFEKVLAIQPEHSEAREYLTQIDNEMATRQREITRLLAEAEKQQRAGNYVSASRLYRRILVIEPDHDIARKKLQGLGDQVRRYVQKNFAQGEKAFANGKLDAAERAFKSVLSSNPGHSRARAYLSQIEQTRIDSAQVYYDLGMKYFDQKKWDDALTNFEAALSIYPGFESAKEMREKVVDAAGVQKVVERGKSEFFSGHYLKAMEIFSEALDLDPNNKEAIELREKCQQRLNEEVEDYYNRGIRFYTAEDYRAAIAEWDKALKINPQHKGSLEYKQKAEQRLKALNRLQ